jgi:hypothetical protein
MIAYYEVVEKREPSIPPWAFRILSAALIAYTVLPFFALKPT